MADHLRLYLFGDQTFDTQPALKGLAQQSSNPVLEAFLNKAYSAIRLELYQLPRDVREDLPRFTGLEDLLLWKADGKRCVPLDMAVTCMYQLGSFISQIDSRHYSAENSCILGLCTGALAAAAVSCSQNTIDLIPLAVDAVIVAFRTGMHVTRVGQSIEPSVTPERTWSIVVPGVESSHAVHSFCQETRLPLTSQPYISAYTPTGITVSGPPRSLAEFTTSNNFSGLRFAHIPIHGPYHASHLYSLEDVDEIVGSLGPRSISANASRIPVFSSTGALVQDVTFQELLKIAVSQILLHPISWTGVLNELHSWLQHANPKRFSVTPIGTKADQLIYNEIKKTPLRDLLWIPISKQSPTLEENVSSSNPAKPKLAIIGMSGRFPGASHNEAFWDLLYQGLDVHKPVPELHWNAKTHVDTTQTKKNTSATPFGCWIDDPAGFDARFFNISPREAPQIDPAQRLGLMTAYEAIEQAGIVPDATPSTRRDRVGVFYGVTSNDWMETNSAQNIDTYFIPGGNRAFIPGRINYCFKFSGPSFAVDTACSSSLAGIHLACNALWRGDIDTAIAGGTNILTNPDFTAGLDRGHFLSRTGNCKTFDDSADGYCRGEGVGSVIIKRLDDALADKNPILGVILGAYTNHSAESESITRPHGGAQRAVFSKILNQGLVDPSTVSYIEMHGTGTQTGDASEMSSVLDVFAPPLDKVKQGRRREEALYLGSAKANIGHGEASSGVTSLIKVLLMMQKNTIVPHCGIKTKINHKFPTDLEERNVHIARKPTIWERGSKPRRVFVNNFSAAGGNSALLLEDAPPKIEPQDETPDLRTCYLVAVSAKNGVSLQGNLRSMLKFLKQNPEVSLGKLSYTTTARRLHHQHRVMLAGANVNDLSAEINAALTNKIGMTRPKSAPKTVFTFTGQGAQYPGMGKQLFETFSFFRAEMRRLDQITRSLGFPSILPVVQSDERDIGIFPPTAVQLASVCLQISLSKLWALWGIAPVAVVGHSLGEYAALNVAGVLSDTDTVYLVGKRAELLQQKCTRDTHAMLVVKGCVEEIASALKDHNPEIACINFSIETVLAGPSEDVAIFRKVLSEKGFKSTLLKVPYAFHSSQIDPILEDFKDLARGVTFSAPKIPVICPLDGAIVKNEDIFNSEYLARHSREPVNMQQALLAAHSHQLIPDQATFLELGPHPAISGMVKAVVGSHVSTLASMQRGRPVWDVLAATLNALYTKGADIGWDKFQEDFKASHEVLQLPAYSWDLKEYWIQYVNDWSLYKGDPPRVISGTDKIESTTIHRIVEETGDSHKAHMVVEADIARKDLSPLVQGHEVDGIPLCTPSVYADIALSLGTYFLERYLPKQKECLVDVSDMIISKALILRDGATTQLLQAHAEADWSSNAATVKFMSFDSHQKLQEHARCVIKFQNGNLQTELQQNAANIKQKMQALRDGIVTETTARFNRPMVYRAIRPLARFHDDYRAIDEIVLNSSTLEASSRLSFGGVKREGNFHTHPAVIDSLTQSCGFTMNCNDSTDLDTQVFMNHGWGSLQIFEPLDFEKLYTTYTRMVEGADKLWHGDVVIFDGDKVVAFFGQIAIQGVPRRVLQVILSIESGSKSQKKQPVQKHHAPQEVKALPSPDLVNESVYTSQAGQAVQIISEESGIAISDLTDQTVFADVGIDSLMALTISARLKEEIGLDLDFNAFFFEYPTVAALKALLGGTEATSGTPTPASPRSSATGITTPDVEPSSLKVKMQRALEIIAEESGLAIQDLNDDINFADAGVDSLLWLVVVSRYRDELDLEIMHDSIFLECPTVADLKKLFLGDLAESLAKNELSPATVNGAPDPEPATQNDAMQLPGKATNPDLIARKKAVDALIKKYTAGFSLPVPAPASLASSNDEEITVLVTGASGSLGSHLVYHLAQLPKVKKIVCLNRENKTEPYVRQQKAMREKGIRFPEALKPKLVVLQTDSSKPRFGLSTSEYDQLVHSVTHLIHNAWPMSAKRPLSGFESQFQVMRNLIDFAGEVVSRRPKGFQFGFQMVSSIGVVGHYGLGNGERKTVVPEERVSIETVLPNGYGDAKWGCERMLDETLHRHPDRFRTMVVRLGQIAGSKTSGYWNPMEHFGFLIKSSQTLNALPDVDGTVYWTPVNDIAETLSELVLADRTPYPIYHIENPVGQSWREMNKVLADALDIPNLIPFEEWVERVRAAPQRNNPAATLLDFLDSNYLRMSCGGLVLDVKKTLEHSKTLAAVGPVSEKIVRKYIHIWKEIGFLN